jgi:hypothetical protein
MNECGARHPKAFKPESFFYVSLSFYLPANSHTRYAPDAVDIPTLREHPCVSPSMSFIPFALRTTPPHLIFCCFSSARETLINSGRLLEPPFRATPLPRLLWATPSARHHRVQHPRRRNRSPIPQLTLTCSPCHNFRSPPSVCRVVSDIH